MLLRLLAAARTTPSPRARASSLLRSPLPDRATCPWKVWSSHARAPARPSGGNTGRVTSGSSFHGGMVIKPVSRRLAHARIARSTAGSDSGAAPAFDSSCESFTSIITSSGGRPDPDAARAFRNRRSRSPETYPRPRVSYWIADGRSGETRRRSNRPAPGCLPSNSCT